MCRGNYRIRNLSKIFKLDALRAISYIPCPLNAATSEGGAHQVDIFSDNKIHFIIRLEVLCIM